jgi:hypothetical protein
MRTLWHTTVSFLRKYPILWLPVVIARLITFHLDLLDDSLRFEIGHRLLPRLMHTRGHSVMGGAIVSDVAEPEALRRASAITAPIHYAALFIGDFLFACALIAIAAMLHSFATTGRSSLRETARPVFRSAQCILVYCLKLFGVSFISGQIVSFLAPYAGSFIDHNGPLKLLHLSLESQVALGSSPVFVDLLYHLWILPITLCVVYVMAPIELHLLQPPYVPPAPNQRRQARLAGTMAAVAVSALGVAAWAAQRSLFLHLIFHTDRNNYLASLVASLVRAVPYAPLYIVLYLIANPTDVDQSAPD